VYLDEFRDDWDGLHGHDSDEHALWALELAIMSDPTAGEVIAGTGGLRKLRFAAAEAGKGKSGGDRICYPLFPSHHVVLMVMAYGKGAKANLTLAEKQGIKKYLEITQRWFDDHPIRGTHGQE